MFHCLSFCAQKRKHQSCLALRIEPETKDLSCNRLNNETADLVLRGSASKLDYEWTLKGGACDIT